jgi:GNAT superfamily N-acetyltransferase
MNTGIFTTRTMTRQEMDIAIGWAASEGWNPGLYDADCFYQADPDGFLIGMLDDEPVATISVVKYGGSFAFLGFYIVKLEHRGKGYGMRLWNAGLSCLHGFTVGLDGVVSQQANYRKSGFEPAYRNVRYQGSGGGAFSNDSKITPLSMIPFEDIYLYDYAFFQGDRKKFLECWINQPGSTALAVIVNHQISGYGVIRKCFNGFKVGPLFADNPEFADILFTELSAYVPEGSPVFLDVPEVNPDALKLTKRHNMDVVFETARMYKGKCPELPLKRLYGVTSFELG